MFTVNGVSTSRSGGMSGGSGSMIDGQQGAMAVLVAAGIAFIAALVIYITIVQMKKRPTSKFLNFLREYLNFRDILLDGLIKFTYVFMALFVTLMSIIMMTQGGEYILGGLIMLTFGNVGLRLLFELIMIGVGIWKNLTDIQNSAADINEKLGKLPSEAEKDAEKAVGAVVERPAEGQPAENIAGKTGENTVGKTEN